ncbi:MAG: PKD domain-containing protein, partial [Gemmatimonadetes bacterium]
MTVTAAVASGPAYEPGVFRQEGNHLVRALNTGGGRGWVFEVNQAGEAVGHVNGTAAVWDLEANTLTTFPGVPRLMYINEHGIAVSDGFPNGPFRCDVRAGTCEPIVATVVACEPTPGPACSTTTYPAARLDSEYRPLAIADDGGIFGYHVRLSPLGNLRHNMLRIRNDTARWEDSNRDFNQDRIAYTATGNGLFRHSPINPFGESFQDMAEPVYDEFWDFFDWSFFDLGEYPIGRAFDDFDPPIIDESAAGQVGFRVEVGNDTPFPWAEVGSQRWDFGAEAGMALGIDPDGNVVGAQNGKPYLWKPPSGTRVKLMTFREVPRDARAYDLTSPRRIVGVEDDAPRVWTIKANPTAVSVEGPDSVVEGTGGAWTVSATDPDGESLTYAIVAADGTETPLPEGRFTGKLRDDGTLTWRLRARNRSGTFTDLFHSVPVVNHPPEPTGLLLGNADIFGRTEPFVIPAGIRLDFQGRFEERGLLDIVTAHLLDAQGDTLATFTVQTVPDNTTRLFFGSWTVPEGEHEGLRFVLRDDDGGEGTIPLPVFRTFGANSPPTVALEPAAPTVLEGGEVTFTATANDADGDELTYEWDFGEGFSAGGPTASRTYADDGQFSVTVRVSDGMQAATATATVDVVNVGVSILRAAYRGDPSVIQLGDELTVEVDFEDPGVLDEHTLSVHWSDGVVTAGTVSGRTATASRTFTEGGVVNATVRLTEVGGATAVTGLGDVRINRPPTLDLPPTRTEHEGTVVVLDALVLAADPDGEPLSFLWTLPDGSTSAAATVPVALAQDGESVVGLEATDPTGATARGEIRFAVLNVAPSELQAALDAAEVAVGETVTVSGTFRDPGLLDTHTVTVNWGDGTTATLSPARDGEVWSFTGEHTYQAVGEFGVAVTVVDERGAGIGPESAGIISVTRADDPVFLLTELVERVKAAEASGELRRQDARRLIRWLTRLERELERGRVRAARGLLRGFAAHVRALTRGRHARIDRDLAAELLRLAKELETQLEERSDRRRPSAKSAKSAKSSKSSKSSK